MSEQGRPGHLLQRAQMLRPSPNALKALGAIALVVITVSLFRWLPASAQEEFMMEPAAGQQDVATLSEGDKAQVTVHIAGAVLQPGVYELEKGARIDDAIEAAGGFAPGACPYALNLARELVDGEQIIVPTQEQVDAQGAMGALDATGSATVGGASGSGALININTAAASELEQLPGIGPATAENIVAYRTENGPFATTENIQDVPGIGKAKYARIASLICV